MERYTPLQLPSQNRESFKLEIEHNTSLLAINHVSNYTKTPSNDSLFNAMQQKDH